MKPFGKVKSTLIKKNKATKFDEDISLMRAMNHIRMLENTKKTEEHITRGTMRETEKIRILVWKIVE